jgi:hypothetical protein
MCFQGADKLADGSGLQNGIGVEEQDKTSVEMGEKLVDRGREPHITLIYP